MSHTEHSASQLDARLLARAIETVKTRKASYFDGRQTYHRKVPVTAAAIAEEYNWLLCLLEQKL